jgi:hypothetical protein
MLSQATDAEIAALAQLPLSNFMPPQGVEFRYHNGITIPAVGVTSNVLQLAVPKGMNGIINRLANVVNGPGYADFAGTTQWQLFTDLTSGTLAPNFGTGVAGASFGTLVASLGAINNPAILNGIRIRENQLVTLQFTNVSLAPAGQIVGALLGGFFYPVSLEPVMGF